MSLESTTPQPLFIGVEEASKRLGLTPSTTRAAILAGDIPSKKFSGQYKIPTAFLRQMEAGDVGQFQRARRSPRRSAE